MKEDVILKNIDERKQKLTTQQRMLLALKDARAKLEAVEQMQSEPIAVVGMGCRFPGGADNPDAYWRLLINGIDAVTEVPPERWKMDDYYDPDPDKPGKIYSRSGAFLKMVDMFDPQFFGMTPKEAVSIDPQQRLMLEVSWEAFESAGLMNQKLKGSSTGVFIGITTNDYGQLLMADDDLVNIDSRFISGNPLNASAGRISFTFGLHGPSVAVDTACSSSLTSVHLACKSLRARECDMALAGGVNLILTPIISVALSRAGMLSPDGRCKTFDAGAKGLVRGEGCGAVVLKRYSDAVKDGDNILALIKGSAINQDGASSGFTAPNGVAQESLIRSAVEIAGIDPTQVDYAEAHGTGTPLGDPIEVVALGNVYCNGRDRSKPLMIGSVKTNIGHLESAAGVAGLIKVILSMQNREIPPHLHFTTPNPNIPWDKYPITVMNERKAWRSNNGNARLATVSSFGASGANAHIIVGEPPGKAESKVSLNRHLSWFTLSAKTEKALKELSVKYEQCLTEDSGLNVTDVCRTTNEGRIHFKHRMAILTDSLDSLISKLKDVNNGLRPDGVFFGYMDDVLVNIRKTEAHPERIEELGALYVNGASIDWTPFYKGNKFRCVALPTYPFQRERYWVETKKSKSQERGFFKTNRDKILNHLLGRQIISATTDAIFESRIGLDSPPYLKHHCIFDTAVLPAAAYITMALDAGAHFFKSENIVLEDVVFQEALTLEESDLKNVQLVLSPECESAASFKIYSLTEDSGNENQLWLLHAFGNMIVHGDNSDDSVNSGFEALQTEMVNEVEIEGYYQRLQHNGLNYGPDFRVVKRLFYDKSSALGHITLFQGSGFPGNGYKLHPILLDGAFQVLGAVLPELSNGKTSLPVEIKRLQLFRSGNSQIVSHAKVKFVDEMQSALTSDLTIYEPGGQLVAFVEGLKLKLVSRDALKRSTEHSLDDWFYKIEWSAKSLKRMENRSGGMPDIREICSMLKPRFEQICSSEDRVRRAELLGALEYLSVHYIIDAFQQLGFVFKPGERFNADAICNELNIDLKHTKLICRMLQILGEEGVVQQTDGEWEVVSSQAAQFDAERPEVLLTRFPDGEAELTMLKRCGSNLASVLMGRINPLELLFSGQQGINAESLYNDSDDAKLMNALIREITSETQKQLSNDRKLRILEVGAGTGGVTSHVMANLNADSVEYCFTDVSRSFITRAQKRFSCYDFVSYEIFDVEKGPENQGFGLFQYDMIIASNVLHTTKDVNEAVGNLRKLLVPDGVFILLEATSRLRYIDLIFGVTDGWWRFTDYDVRDTHPLLTVKGWQKSLKNNGFKNLTTVPYCQSESPVLSKQTIIMGQAEALLTNRTDGSVYDMLSEEPGNWVIFTDNNGIGKRLGSILKSKYKACIFVSPGMEYKKIAEDEYGVNPVNPDDFFQFFKEIAGEKGCALKGIVYLWSLDVVGAKDLSLNHLTGSFDSVCGSVLHIVQAILKASLMDIAGLWLVTRHAQSVLKNDNLEGLAQSPLYGMNKVIAMEHPEMKCRCVDMDLRDNAANAQTLFEEMYSKDQEYQVAYRDNVRYAPRMGRYEIRKGQIKSESLFMENAAYLITGGLGGLGLVTAQWMITRGARHIVLVARNSNTDQCELLFKEFRGAGAEVVVIQADVSDEDAMVKVFKQIDNSMPSLKGVMHCAGVLDDGVLMQQNSERFKNVMTAKVQGGWNLHSLTKELDLDFFLLFSSAVTLLGSAGQANHVAANLFLDVLAQYRQAHDLPGLSIDWGAWSQVGAASGKDITKRINLRGIDTIVPSQGLRALELLITQPVAQVGVVPVKWSEFAENITSGYHDTLLEDIIEQELRRNESDKWNTESPVRDKLSIASPDERYSLLTSYVKEKVVKVMGLNFAQLDIKQSLNTLGLDSLIAVDLRNCFKSELGIDVPMVKLIEGRSVEGLIELLNQFFVTPDDSGDDLIEGEI